MRCTKNGSLTPLEQQEVFMMTEPELIQAIACHAELTLEAATRAYKAMQVILPLATPTQCYDKAAEPMKLQTMPDRTLQVVSH